MQKKQIKDREIRVEDIPEYQKKILVQNFKPYFAFVLAYLIAGVTIYFESTRIIGIIFAILVTALMISIKNRKYVLITDSFTVSYNDDNETCKIVYYDEVTKWDLSQQGNMNSVIFTLTDGSQVCVPIRYLNTVEDALKKVMADKQDKHEIKIHRERRQK